MRRGGRWIGSVVLALAVVGCSSAGAADAAPAARPPTTAVAPSSSSTTTTQPPTTTTVPPTTTTTAPPPPPRVDCAVARCVALTFDDGPAESTPEVLDILASRGVPATFFMIGVQVEAYPDIARQVAAAGHEVENHTYSHHDLTATTPDAARDDVLRGAEVIEAATGRVPSLVRPPQGAMDAALRDHIGVPEVVWSVDPEDWLTKDPAATVQRVAERVRPGSIVLMHDIYPTTVVAVAPIVDLLRSQGYELVTVTELLGPGLTTAESYGGRAPG